MAKGSSLNVFAKRINLPNEVKAFDNQRNATQACHMHSNNSAPLTLRPVGGMRVEEVS
jgi:hypothetical protein